MEDFSKSDLIVATVKEYLAEATFEEPKYILQTDNISLHKSSCRMVEEIGFEIERQLKTW